MWMYVMGALFIGTLALSPQPALGEVTIDTATLAGDVQNREPVGTLAPAAACKSGESGEGGAGEQSDVPVFDSSMSAQIFFWNRLQTDSTGTLRHTWYMNREQGWREAAEIDLNYAASPGYRTWSSKQIDPSLHTGEWKVEVTTIDEPDRVLCTARFRVQ